MASHSRTLVAGNTDMWVSAVVALGLQFGWPVAFLLLKPSSAPLMLIGLRAWKPFLVTGILVIAELALLPLLQQYLVAISNAGAGASVLYSLPSAPLLLLPVVAWAFRTTPRPTIVPEVDTRPEVAGPLPG